jgi:myxalamid-type polyketide synthase MxaB
VLNSLAGEDFISRSMSTVARGGWFIEIGRTGVWSKERVAQERPDVRYEIFDLGTARAREPAVFGELLVGLAARCAGSDGFKVRTEVFGICDTARAMRHMQRSEHIGKIVITHPTAVTRPRIVRGGAYVVTGGLGGLGTVFCRWLVQRGAGHVVLVGRKEPSAAVRDAAEQVGRETGASVVFARADVARADELRAVLAGAGSRVYGQEREGEGEGKEASRPMLPLCGVLHSAGVLEDAPIPRQSVGTLERVFGPKVSGAWNLHELTRRDGDSDECLLVLFSSVSALLGTFGQANYAAANAFMDGLARMRTHEGYGATLSVRWGAWGNVGMAASATVMRGLG